MDLGTASLWPSYADFPWFAGQSAELVRAVERPAPEHLYWRALDIDLALASIRDPSAFPRIAAHP